MIYIMPDPDNALKTGRPLDDNVANIRPPQSRDATGRFLPGHQVGGHGRPPLELTLTSVLRQRLSEIDPVTRKTHVQLIISRWLEDMESGPPPVRGREELLRMALDRLEGGVRQGVDLSVSQRSISIIEVRLPGELGGSEPALDGNPAVETKLLAASS